MTRTYRDVLLGRVVRTQPAASDPVAQAEAALKKLRANPNDQQAAEALETASKQLSERAKPQRPAGGLGKN